MRLSEICNIQTGYTVRGRLEVVDDGDSPDGVPVMTLRDFRGDKAVWAGSTKRVKLDWPDKRYFVGAGDVVFKSRGEKNTAFALGNDFQEPSVAVLPLMVIKPKSSKVIPEYLAWLINSPKSQSYFDAEAQGTSMRMISKSTLDDLDVVVPEISIQQKIVEVAELASRTKKLLADLAKLAELQTRIISASLMKETKKFKPIPKKELSQ